MTGVPRTNSDDAPTREPPRRLFAGTTIAFLCLQLALPLSYYVGRQTYDERFSWRMFSPVHLQRCSMDVTEVVTDQGTVATRPTPLVRLLPGPWLGLMNRYRPAVVHRFLEWRCEFPEIREVSYTRRCQEAGGSPLPEQTHTRICSEPRRDPRS